ncbi:MAG TPA: PaaI family thioesterase [Gemmatimonadaceae bacterium]|nr:PaaI family thioesterase [Gemmatimonadaceae bacterium]
MQAPDGDYETRVRSSFDKQRFMTTIGATLSRVQPGEVAIDLEYRDDLVQQHGFLHAGVVAAIVDSACGYAALTLMRPGTAVLTVEYKVNLLAPAQGQAFRAHGRVVRSGRTITVCTGDVSVVETGSTIAVMQATMIAVDARDDRRD